MARSVPAAENHIEIELAGGHRMRISGSYEPEALARLIRGRRGDLVKVIWWDGQGACMFLKRLEKGWFVWPSAREGKVALTPAQLSMLLEGSTGGLCSGRADPWQRDNLLILQAMIPTTNTVG